MCILYACWGSGTAGTYPTSLHPHPATDCRRAKLMKLNTSVELGMIHSKLSCWWSSSTLKPSCWWSSSSSYAKEADAKVKIAAQMLRREWQGVVFVRGYECLHSLGAYTLVIIIPHKHIKTSRNENAAVLQYSAHNYSLIESIKINSFSQELDAQIEWNAIEQLQ